MDENANAIDRPVGDYVLFALEFLGFGIAAGGVVLASAAVAVSGLVILLLALCCFAWLGAV